MKSDGSALVVRDEEVLARFPLERVLGQIISTAGATITPTELLQRLFDTENRTLDGAFSDVVHCDDRRHPALALPHPVDCSRAEGALARRSGFFVPGAADYFAPVALVNRFDLTPSSLSTCGEYRIIYAKWSGRSDPNDRVLLIFEGALVNPQGTVAGCRPAADLWAGLDDLTSSGRADRLEMFFFKGVGDFSPVVHVDNYGIRSFNEECAYSGSGGCGQVRVGQGMQAPWKFRQFWLQKIHPDAGSTRLSVDPTRATGSFAPELFGSTAQTASSASFRDFFLSNVPTLAGADPTRIRVNSEPSYETGESAIDGPARPNYASRVAMSADGVAFVEQIEKRLLPHQGGCPANDPLTATSILERATALTCAGCHAPEKLLSSERRIGCGAVWPKSLGETHIDEKGTLSEALTQVFLPRRANVLATYLQACDYAAIHDNFQPVVFRRFIVECFAAGTPITMADGSTRAIEHVAEGEMVLTFDERERRLKPGLVTRTVVRPHTDRLIVINGSVVATPNHPFRTARGWVRADALNLDDTLFQVRDVYAVGPIGVSQLLLEPSSAVTYNLEIAEHHSYFAGGLLVHDRP